MYVTPHPLDSIRPKVLIVEDSLMMLKRLTKLLHEAGFDPITAMSLHEVQQILLHNYQFFAAVADYCLPDAIEGEILPLLIDANIPTLALTAHSDISIRDKILALSVVDYVPKDSPAALEYVVRMLNRLQKNPNIGVLIVDDAALMRNYLRHLLERQHYQVFEANSAQAGLNVLLQERSIRLVLTDQDMPGMDGMRFASEIRRRYGNHRLSIIGISGLTNPVIGARFIKAGADDFMHKPFSPEEFFCRITRNIEFIENVQALEHAANRDPLTNLSNRRHFLDQMARVKGEYCVAISDIDFFKQVNDTYGHDIGDVAIQFVGQLLQEHFPDGLTARFGGEEFVTAIANGNISDFVSRLNDVRQQLMHRPVTTPQGELRLNISIGVSAVTKHSLTATLKQADEALYLAKQQGRNQVQLAG